jgi:hypothetical protein
MPLAYPARFKASWIKGNDDVIQGQGHSCRDEIIVHCQSFILSGEVGHRQASNWGGQATD